MEQKKVDLVVRKEKGMNQRKVDLVIRKEPNGELRVGFGFEGRIKKWVLGCTDADSVRFVFDGFGPGEILDRASKLVDGVFRKIIKDGEAVPVNPLEELVGKRVYVNTQGALDKFLDALREKGFEGRIEFSSFGGPDEYKVTHYYWVVFPEVGKFEVRNIWGADALLQFEKISLKDCYGILTGKE